MYLCRFAHAVQDVNPADMILKFMPLKADRILPGQLLKTMRDHGFVLLSRVPKVFKSVVVPMPVPAVPPVPLPQAQHVAPMKAQHAAAPVNGEHDHSPQKPLNVGERVVYWSESVSKWIDAVVMAQHVDPQGMVVCYDLDVKPMADGAKIRRKTPSPGATPRDGVSSRRSNDGPSRHGASKEGGVTPPCQPRCLPQHVESHEVLSPGQPFPSPQTVAPDEGTVHCKNAGDLSSIIAMVVDEGWFSSADIETALREARGKKGGRDEAKFTAGPKSSRDVALVVAGPKCLITV